MYVIFASDVIYITCNQNAQNIISIKIINKSQYLLQLSFIIPFDFPK